MRLSEPQARVFVPWLTDPRTPVTLLCFHCAGGSAQSFFAWKAAARGLCDLLAVELPGRSRRYQEAFASSIPELAAEIARASIGLTEKPLIFFGHSLGALLAYETVRALLRLGGPTPSRLILSSRQSCDWRPVHSGLPELHDVALQQYLQDMAGTPRQVLENPALVAMALPPLRADLELLYNYRYTPGLPLPVPISVLGGIDDAHVTFESLLAWSRATERAFELEMLDGGHFAVMEQPGRVLHSLSTCL